jgi:hypothetical protein
VQGEAAVTEDSTSAKKTGRPRKTDGPKVPYQQVDRILVFGELVDPGDGNEPTVVFPSYRELAKRFGVCHSVIADYAKKHDCMRRREQAQTRVEARTDEKLIELRASALAVSKDDTLRIIDAYIAGFEKAVADGRVRFENPTDFNTMVRLKEFIQGGADSRQEIHAALSLEDLQARHKKMLQSVEATSAAERGEAERVPAAIESGEREADAEPPPGPLATPPRKPGGGFAPVARASPDDEEPDPGENAAHGGGARAEGGP